MIKEEYREDVLTAKEMLSKEGGWFVEDKVPCIGGPLHGDLMPMKPTGHGFMREWENHTFVKLTTVYAKQAICIDEEANWIYVYRAEHLDQKECEDAFECWAKGWVIDMNKMLTEDTKI